MSDKMSVEWSKEDGTTLYSGGMDAVDLPEASAVCIAAILIAAREVAGQVGVNDKDVLAEILGEAARRAMEGGADEMRVMIKDNGSP